MNKRILFFVLSIFLVALGMNFVSASLCKSYNGYYYDCDNVPFRYSKSEQGYRYYEGNLMKYEIGSGERYRTGFYQGYRRGFDDGKKYCDDCSDSVVVILDFEEKRETYWRDNNYNSNCYCKSWDYWKNCNDYRCY